MRISRFALVTLALLPLSGCYSSDPHDYNVSGHDFGDWLRSKPSHMGNLVGDIPTGYDGQNDAGKAVLHPPPRAVPAPAPEAASVTVYPIDGSAPAPVAEGGPVYYGDLIDQIYFADGSARIGRADRAKLTGLAHGALSNAANGHAPAITVVGYASVHVNRHDDAVRKEEVNRSIGQRRADAVAEVLVHAGLDPALVHTLSKGDEDPNPHRGRRSQEAADRRVEIFMNDK